MTPRPSREPGQAGVSDAEARSEYGKHYTVRWNRSVCAACRTEWPCVAQRLLADRTQREERIRALETSLADWNEHLGGCSAGISKLPCKCGVEEARALLREVQDAKTE